MRRKTNTATLSKEIPFINEYFCRLDMYLQNVQQKYRGKSLAISGRRTTDTKNSSGP